MRLWMLRKEHGYWLVRIGVLTPDQGMLVWVELRRRTLLGLAWRAFIHFGWLADTAWESRVREGR